MLHWVAVGLKIKISNAYPDIVLHVNGPGGQWS